MLAARLLVDLNFEADLRDNTGTNIEAIASTLCALRPHLTGNIAADVADLLDNPATPITERMACVG